MDSGGTPSAWRFITTRRSTGMVAMVTVVVKRIYHNTTTKSN